MHLLGGQGGDFLALRYSKRSGDVADGSSGRDTILGGTGADQLIGGSGRDRILAGAGNDHVRSKDGVKDFVNCGPGNDHIVADAVDSLSSC